MGRNVLLLVFLILLFLELCCLCNSLPNLQRLDRCVHKGQSGVCRRLGECPDVLDAIKRGIKHIVACNFNKTAPAVICCFNRRIFFPSSDTSSPQTPDSRGSTSSNLTLPLEPVKSTNPIEPVIVSEEPPSPSTEFVPPVDTNTESPPSSEQPLLSEFDILNPILQDGLPTCGFRAAWAVNEVALPFYFLNGSEFSFGEGTVRATEDSPVNIWPWTALLGYPSSDGAINWSCDGSLINNLWIITAASCLEEGFPVVIRFGEHDYNVDNEGATLNDFGVDRVEVYPNYVSEVAYHDLALIKLDKAVDMTDSFFLTKPPIVPICLPWGIESTATLIDRSVALTGWGISEFGGQRSSVLQMNYLRMLDSAVCDDNYKVLSMTSYNRIFPAGITNQNFACARNVDGRTNHCHIDSGGPLVYNTLFGFYLTGVLTKGYGCGQKDLPGLFTPLHKPQYLDWIKRNAF